LPCTREHRKNEQGDHFLECNGCVLKICRNRFVQNLAAPYLFLQIKLSRMLVPMRVTLLSACFLLFLFACKNKLGSGKDNRATTQSGAEPPAGFMDFYRKFHEDSLYQIAHITWPLRGESTEQVDAGHTKKVLETWEPETWRMHRPVDFSSGDFKREFEVMGDAMVIERISFVAANYALERRFYLNENGEWELIYYADMQEITHNYK